MTYQDDDKTPTRPVAAIGSQAIEVLDLALEAIEAAYQSPAENPRAVVAQWLARVSDIREDQQLVSIGRLLAEVGEVHQENALLRKRLHRLKAVIEGRPRSGR